MSELLAGGYGPAAVVSSLNDPAANDIQPNVRKDGREIVFSSNRWGGQGAKDIWVALRNSADDPWSAPVNLGAVNTGAAESRPSLSWHGEQLLFGNREIAQQLYLSPRTVDMHVHNMLGKLGCRTRTEATGKAHELGLLAGATAST